MLVVVESTTVNDVLTPGVGRAEEAGDHGQPGGLVGRELDPQHEIDAVVKGALLHLVQANGRPSPSRDRRCRTSRGPSAKVARRKASDWRVVVVQGDADLLEIVDALDAPGGLAGGLDGGQQAGRSSTAMIAITTSNSIKCKGSTMMHFG